MALSHLNEALRQRFADAIPHAKALGVEVTAVSADATDMRLPYRDDWLGDIERGVIHTGVITTLVDGASGLALLAKLANFESIATLDLRMDYLRPAVAGKALHCRAQCYRTTSHIGFVRASVWQDDPEQPVAVSQSVFMRTGVGRSRAAGKSLGPL